MKIFGCLFKKKKLKMTETIQAINLPPVVRKRFCAKPLGEICFGNETDMKCGNCGHWI